MVHAAPQPRVDARETRSPTSRCANVTDPLRGPLRKVDRAKQHIEDLERKVGEFADRNPYRIVVEPSFNPGNTAMISLAVRIREETPDELALLVGDALHNLRSSLDHLACCLVPGGTSDPDCSFPFAKSEQAFEQTILSRPIRKAKPNAIDAIRQLKPYPGGNDTLYGLHVIDNLDKHRLLLPVLGASGLKNPFVVKFGDNPGASVLDMKSFGNVGIQDGQKLVVLPKPGNVQLGDEFDADITILFGEGPFNGAEVLGSLRQLADYIQAIIEPFRGFFP